MSSTVPGVGDGVAVGGIGVGVAPLSPIGVAAAVGVTVGVEVGIGCGVGTAVGDSVGVGSGVDVGSADSGWTGGGVGIGTGSGRDGRPKQAVLRTAATSITAISVSTFHAPISYGMIPLPERRTPTTGPFHCP